MSRAGPVCARPNNVFPRRILVNVEVSSTQTKLRGLRHAASEGRVATGSMAATVAKYHLTRRLAKLWSSCEYPPVLNVSGSCMRHRQLMRKTFMPACPPDERDAGVSETGVTCDTMSGSVKGHNQPNSSRHGDDSQVCNCLV
jgi:hypothetical protein